MKQEECIVYLEAYEKLGDGIVDAYIDFRQRKDLNYFIQLTGFDSVSKTYIELRSLKSAKRLRRGCYYRLNLAMLKDYTLEPNDRSVIIGGIYDFKDMEMPTNDDEELLQKHEALKLEEMSMLSEPGEKVFNIEESGNLSLFVKDVGQANWNELRSDDSIAIVYDVGARLSATKTEVDSIVNSRKNDLTVSRPVLVISHWDMDHIHCLKSMTEEDIREYFSKVVCPDKLKSLTSTDILDKCKRALGTNNVYCLSLPRRTDGRTMHLWRREGIISLYKGESSSQPNYCGLVMFVRGTERSANYTGDCRLSQAGNAYQQEMDLGLDTREHVLIAPHHGGDCGASHRHYHYPCNLIEISVGQNPYGHPQNEMVAYLQSLGVVKQTRDVGDITETL